MKLLLLAALLCLTALVPAEAQFSPAFLQNGSYWGNGKAEFNIYQAEITRYGQPRSGEALHILVPEPYDEKQFVKPDDWKRPGIIPVMKLNQVLHIPTGLYVYQQMHSNFWRIDDGRLWKFSLTSNDSCGNTYKEARRQEENFQYEYRTYWDGMARGEEEVALPPGGRFYDELPLLVRLLDFSKAKGEAEVPLAGTTIGSKKDTFKFFPARFAWSVTKEGIIVEVSHGGGTDRMVLETEFPHLLREWKTADGSSYRLKRSLRVDYWNYNQPGDRERALDDPKLQHPD